MSVGVPVFNTDVRVVTDAGHEARPGEIGELVIAGPQIIPGYWQKPEETAESLRNGELRTGDVGFMDEQGWFYLVDRAKDMIVASGFKVWPREVEEVLYLHPAVREAAVVGVPDPYRGETIKAVISLKAGLRGDRGRDQGVRARAHGGLQIPARRRDHRRSAEDDERQDHAPPAADDHWRGGVADAGAELELVAVSYPQLRAAVEARAVLEVGATWLRLSRGPIPAFDVRGALRAAAADARAARRRRTVRRSRRIPGGERGLSRRGHRPGRERASVAGLPPAAAARALCGGAQGHARHARERRVPPRTSDRLDRGQRCRRAR